MEVQPFGLFKTRPRRAIERSRMPRDGDTPTPTYKPLVFEPVGDDPEQSSEHAPIPPGALCANAFCEGLPDDFRAIPDPVAGEPGAELDAASVKLPPLRWRYAIFQVNEPERMRDERHRNYLYKGNTVALRVFEPSSDFADTFGFMRYETAMLAANTVAMFRDVLHSPSHIMGVAQRWEVKSVNVAALCSEIAREVLDGQRYIFYAPDGDDFSQGQYKQNRGGMENKLATAAALVVLYFHFKRQWSYFPDEPPRVPHSPPMPTAGPLDVSPCEVTPFEPCPACGAGRNEPPKPGCEYGSGFNGWHNEFHIVDAGPAEDGPNSDEARKMRRKNKRLSSALLDTWKARLRTAFADEGKPERFPQACEEASLKLAEADWQEIERFIGVLVHEHKKKGQTDAPTP